MLHNTFFSTLSATEVNMWKRTTVSSQDSWNFLQNITKRHVQVNYMVADLCRSFIKNDCPIWRQVKNILAPKYGWRTYLCDLQQK